MCVCVVRACAMHASVRECFGWVLCLFCLLCICSCVRVTLVRVCVHVQCACTCVCVCASECLYRTGNGGEYLKEPPQMIGKGSGILYWRTLYHRADKILLCGTETSSVQ